MKTKQEIQERIEDLKELLKNKGKSIDIRLDIEYSKLNTYKKALEWVLKEE